MEVNYVCSFGSVCHTAVFMKRNNLKLASYPFDWIISDYKKIIHCIEDDFNIFLDKSYYITISHNKCGHSFYDKQYMFFHHNLLTNEDDYNYFTRCVNRFKKLLKYQGHKLFIMTFVNPENGGYSEDLKNDIFDFNTRLSKYTNDYTILVILHFPHNTNNYNITKNESVHFLELYTNSESNGSVFTNENDNMYLDSIIKEHYKFNLYTLDT
uniref:Papain-like cysteine peptidase n=1 Tax=viral metagenome TaxID=1070528 RepID=A0A6C0EQK8_9ZZZZ